MLIEALHEFEPDAIGFSVISGIINEAGVVTKKLKEYFSVPFIWGGPGPTLEPERKLVMQEPMSLSADDSDFQVAV